MSRRLRQRWTRTIAWLRRLPDAAVPLLTALALITLAGTVWANLQLWPIETLGFQVDLRSGAITHVAPGSAAAQADLRVGDQLQRLYGHPFADVLAAWNRQPLLDAAGPTVTAVVERDGIVVSVVMPRRPPTFDDQRAKVVFLLLAAVCWATGAQLGLARRHEVNAARPVAAFWLLLAGVLGTYIFATDLSLPLFALLSWLLIAILPPLGLFSHLVFPARAVAQRHRRLAHRLLLGTWAGAHLLLAGAWLIWRPSLADLVIHAWLPLILAWSGAFLGGGLLLAAAYRRVAAAHVRRQIRLIASACLIVAAVWLALRVGPALLGIPAPVSEAAIDLAALLIPLAYLISGAAPDLFRLDRIARRCAAFTMTAALGILLAGGAIALLQPSGTDGVIGAIVIAGLILHPLSSGVRQRLLSPDDPERTFAPLRQARQQLTTSLDPQVLADAIQTGLQASFQQPPLALYLVRGEDPMLTLVGQDRLPDLPTTIPAGVLQEHLRQGAPLVEARAVHQAFASTTLSPPEEAAVRHQGVALWGVIRRDPQTLLALVLIGTPGTQDPYRAADGQAIQDLLAAAALAFAHSAAYTRQLQTEATLRELFQAMRRVQDETAFALAREVHDEILNVHVQLNIVSLQRLLAAVDEPAVRAELSLILASERGMSAALRAICERLHPSGLDDPFGLPSVLQRLVEQLAARWPGRWTLEVCGEVGPIEPAIQREVVRIAREALTNAAKHAAAATVTVHLCYPELPGEPATLAVVDDGRTGQAIAPKAGHWGLRNMTESARAAGGALHIARELGGGTRVEVRFPVA